MSAANLQPAFTCRTAAPVRVLCASKLAPGVSVA